MLASSHLVVQLGGQHWDHQQGQQEGPQHPQASTPPSPPCKVPGPLSLSLPWTQVTDFHWLQVPQGLRLVTGSLWLNDPGGPGHPTALPDE